MLTAENTENFMTTRDSKFWRYLR